MIITRARLQRDAGKSDNVNHVYLVNEINQSGCYVKSIFMASNLINKASLILYLPLLPVRYLLKIYSSRLITELKLGSFLWENSGLHSCKQCSGMPICAKEAAIFCRRHSKQWVQLSHVLNFHSILPCFIVLPKQIRTSQTEPKCIKT